MTPTHTDTSDERSERRRVVDDLVMRRARGELSLDEFRRLLDELAARRAS